MVISLTFSNNKISVPIDFYVKSIDEDEIRIKYFQIMKIKTIQFPDMLLKEINSDSENELVEAIINSFQYMQFLLVLRGYLFKS